MKIDNTLTPLARKFMQWYENNQGVPGTIMTQTQLIHWRANHLNPREQSELNAVYQSLVSDGYITERGELTNKGYEILY